MDLHQRQQFDHLLQTATERFVARIEERHRGAEAAIAKLKAAPEGEGVWLGRFVDAIFQDFLLDNADGAAFVLRALPKRTIDGQRAALQNAATVEAALLALAKGLFGELLLRKSLEALEQHSGYQPVQMGGMP
jgi:hypothetical protein